MFALVVFLVSVLFFTRAIMVMTGLLKGPILHSFERYGDEEAFYYPLIHFLVWLPLLLLSAVMLIGERWLLTTFGSSFVLYCTGFGLLGLLYISYRRLIEIARKHPDHFLVFPQWYTELLARTSRGERRRIAYMWLRLPWRTRLLYNSNTEAFHVWLDLVLLATIRAEPDSQTGQDHLRHWSYFE